MALIIHVGGKWYGKVKQNLETPEWSYLLKTLRKEKLKNE